MPRTRTDGAEPSSLENQGGRGRRWPYFTLTVLVALVAVISSYGWYYERQWKPAPGSDMLSDSYCTVADDVLLTLEFTQGYGDVVSVRILPERDRVVVGYRIEPHDDIVATGTSGRYSALFPGGLRGRPVVSEDGTRLPCSAVNGAARRR